jgi:hypothetical protein
MRAKTAKLIPAKGKKRIESVVIRRILDDSPDTSYLGEYSNTRESEYSIDRAHSEDCASVVPNAETAQTTLEHARGTVCSLQEALGPRTEENETEWEALEEAYYLLDGLAAEVTECDCGEHGYMGRNEYRYFNPSFNYVDVRGKLRPDHTAEEVRKYVRQDYDRMESANRGNWCYLGIRADAEISIGSGPGYATLQRITSGGLWGIESDSDKECFAEEERNQLADLREQLIALGFSRRAIAAAFKNVEHKDE